MKTTSDRVMATAAASVVSVLMLAAASASLSAAARPANAPGILDGRLLAQTAPTPTAPGAAAQPSAASDQSAQPSRAGAQPMRGPAARVEARISQLHQQLHITPMEEPQFKAYADAMRSNAQEMQTLFQERGQHPDTTAVGQLHWYAKLTAAHSEAVNKLVPVFEVLYQSLSDQQKKDADAVFAQIRQRRAARRAK
jgi:periplasmic protein CpxP/Spy